ncbi:MAG: ATP-grasp domain-containing protein [Pseudomonadota bacterium]|nr:ATP-grasp domain-containing protein [Pseudomonadota bacterium]
MHTIGIISDIHDWHTDQIELNLRKNNCKVLRIHFDDLILSFKKKKLSFLNDNKINKLNGLWVRFIRSGSIEEITTKLTILHLLKESKVYVHNSADIIEKTVDKVRTTGILNINGFYSPKTFVWFASKKNQFSVKKKYLLKPIFGSQGNDIKMIETKKDLKKISPIGSVFYLQEFIESEKKKNYSDIRVLVSNHKIVSAMERVSNHYITNVFKGATCKKIKINSQIQTLVIKISKIFNLGYAGIDVKFDKKKISILEINGIPSWKGMQNIEKKNISKILVKDFLKKIK